MKFVTRCMLSLLSLTLIGCSYIPKPDFIQNRDKHYLTAQSIQPLRIPPGIDSNSFQAEYPVSDRQYSVATRDVSTVPPGL